jgi:hypothetical protein
MLRVTVELVPFGEEAHARNIAQAVIYNDGTGDRSVGNYVAGFCERGWLGSSEVKGHRREQSVWALVGAAIQGLTSSGPVRD